jgi:Predicted membrane protein (DUF2306)
MPRPLSSVRRRFLEALLVVCFVSLLVGVVSMLISLSLQIMNDASVATFHIQYLSVTLLLMVSVMTGGCQFSSGIFRRNRGVHFLLGNIYLLLVLFIGTPGALILGWKSLPWPWMIPLSILILYWWKSARVAILKVADNDWLGHASWMMRSFACTLSLSLMWSGYLMEVSAAYLIAMAIPILAEVLIRKGYPKKLVKDFFRK